MWSVKNLDNYGLIYSLHREEQDHSGEQFRLQFRSPGITSAIKMEMSGVEPYP
jgi:hypothetical protein